MRMTLYLTCLVVVLELGHVPPTGLGNPLAGHQVAHYHGSRADLCRAQPHSGKSGQATEKNPHHNKRNGRNSLFLKLNPCFDMWRSTWLFLSGLGQVGDACVRAHEDIAGVQGALQEALFGLGYMDAAQRSLRKRIGRHQSQAVHSDLVDAVYGLETGRRGELEVSKAFIQAEEVHFISMARS